jgi:hypothetical protein
LPALPIAKGTVPLAIFGPVGYGLRSGILGAPARATQAASPLVFGLLIDRMGIGVLAISAGLSLSAFVALLSSRPLPAPCNTAKAVIAPGPTTARTIAPIGCSKAARRADTSGFTVRSAPNSNQTGRNLRRSDHCPGGELRVPPNWSSVTPNRSVPRKLAPKPMQE